MIETFTKKADEYLDSAVMLLSQLISFPSVLGEAEEGAPYGRNCAEVLKFAEETLEDEFTVKNFDNHVITVSFNDEPAALGILAHLDVVPVDGQQWTSDPFTADIRDGRIYGRGSIDDKGPAAAVITAMRIIKDMGLPVKNNCRLILGSNEENGFSDIEYYQTKEAFPPMLFTPDGDFPVVTGEKGMIRYEYTGIYDGGDIISLDGGSVVNAVPERAEAVIRCVSPCSAKQLAEKYEGIVFDMEADGEYLKIAAKGTGAHASTPGLGKNALTALMSLLCSLDLKGGLADSVRLLSSLYPYGELHGESAGIFMEDERSGAITSVLSLARCEDGKFSFMTDTRFPLSARCSDIVPVMDEKSGGTGRAVYLSEPHDAGDDSDFVKTLLSVYEDCTGNKGECLIIGGGTYVHHTENGVAFGADWDGTNHMHGADEFIRLDELKRDIIIYAETIYRLCCSAER